MINPALMQQFAPTTNGKHAEAPAPSKVTAFSPDWFAVNLAHAEQALLQREGALAAKAPREFREWCEMRGVVDTLRQMQQLGKAE